MLAALTGRDDHVAVVQVVEAWAAEGTPTARARWIEGRAYLALRLMDRALVRAREVAEAHPDEADALRLLAEVYLVRGWNGRARKPIEALRALGADDADTLWERSFVDAPRPETGARDIEREGDAAKLLVLAERFLATGSFLRATGILERLRRANPDHPRVQALLWGLAGDFRHDAASFDALLDRHAPRGATPRTMWPVAQAAEEPELTESLRLASRLPEVDDPSEERGFPSLFKGGNAATPFDDDPAERTQASRLMKPAEGTGGGGGTDPGAAPSPSGGDTRIMLVLKPGESADRPLHRRADDGDELRETLNLRAWQEAMGVAAPGAPPEEVADAPDPSMEEEDENVVSLAHTEAPSTPAEPEPPATRPIEVIERFATPLVDPGFAEESPTTIAPRPREAPRPRARPRVGVAWLLVAALLAALVILGVLWLAHRTTVAASARTRTGLLDALSTQDYATLLAEEAHLAELRPTPASRAALAEARLVLWAEFDGDPARIEAVRAWLGGPDGVDPRRVEVLRAEEALARGDVGGAVRTLASLTPEDDEEALLVARVLAGQGDAASGLRVLSALKDPNRPRYRLARALLADAAGQRADARTAVAQVLLDDPHHAYAQVLQALLVAGELEPATRVRAIETALSATSRRTLAPRQEGEMRRVEAEAWQEAGDVEKAAGMVATGLARDGTNPGLLYLRAAASARGQALTEAIADLDMILTGRPAHHAAQVARVLVLLDMDRLAEATAQLQSIEGADAAALGTMLDTIGRGAAPTTPVPENDTPLARWARAQVAVVARTPDAATRLDAAAVALRGASDPFLRGLAPRAAAWAALTGDADAARDWLRTLRDEGGDDPAVHVLIGRWYEDHHNRAMAAQHYDRAVRIGPQYALGWYERGRFYLDAGDGGVRTQKSWRDFLALAPSGPRTDRVKERLASR